MSDKKPSGWSSLLQLLWIVSAAVAGVAWLFYFLGSPFSQWPPLRWLGIVPIAIAGVLTALITTARIAIRRHSKKCEKCGKWDAMRFSSKEEYERKQVSVRRTLSEVHTHRGKESTVIETVEKEVFVPGVDVYYRVKYMCRFCDHVRTYIEIETES